VKNKQLTATPC